MILTFEASNFWPLAFPVWWYQHTIIYFQIKPDEDLLSQSCFGQIRLEKGADDFEDDELTSLEWLQDSNLLKNISGSTRLCPSPLSSDDELSDLDYESGMWPPCLAMILFVKQKAVMQFYRNSTALNSNHASSDVFSKCSLIDSMERATLNQCRSVYVFFVPPSPSLWGSHDIKVYIEVRHWLVSSLRFRQREWFIE